VLRLVAVREGDVRKVDVKGRAGLEHLIGAGENRGKGCGLHEAAVSDGMQVRKVEHGADPATARGDREHVLCRAELPHASHDLDAERDRAILLLQPLAELAELLDDRVDRHVTLATEQEPWMKDDDLGAARLRDARGVVEHADGHVELLAPLGVSHEAGDRSMDGQDDPGVAREFAESLRPRVVHPELALEVDLAGGVVLLLQELDGFLGAVARGHARRAEVQLGHVPRVPVRAWHQTAPAGPVADAVRRLSYPRRMANKPSRIDLLELDIDLRLIELWREAAEITEWNLDVVAAFMRAAYGKGYCDALTEDAPGSLCHDHGYRIPGRRPAPAHD